MSRSPKSKSKRTMAPLRSLKSPQASKKMSPPQQDLIIDEDRKEYEFFDLFELKELQNIKEMIFPSKELVEHLNRLRFFGNKINSLEEQIAFAAKLGKISVMDRKIKDTSGGAVAKKGKDLSEFSSASVGLPQILNLITSSNTLVDRLPYIASILTRLIDGSGAVFSGRAIDYTKPIVLVSSGDVASVHVVEQGRKAFTRFSIPYDIPPPASSSVVSDSMVRIGDRTFKIQIADGSIFAASVDDLSGPESLNKHQRAVLARPRPDRPASAEENRPGQMVRVRLEPSLVEALDRAVHERGSNRTELVDAALRQYLQFKP